MARQNPQYPELLTLATEIAEDMRTLDRVMRLLGVRRGWIKRLLAVLVEIGSQVSATSHPLIRVLELETLISGVTAKRRLWVALESCSGELLGIDLNSLRLRASSQIDRLETLHSRAARQAFGSA
jgi:hypothetical protein